MLEVNRQLEYRDEEVDRLKSTYEIARLEAERHSALVTSLRQRVAECETQHQSLEGAASHDKQQLATVQADYRQAKQHILQLETQIRLINI